MENNYNANHDKCYKYKKRHSCFCLNMSQKVSSEPPELLDKEEKNFLLSVGYPVHRDVKPKYFGCEYCHLKHVTSVGVRVYAVATRLQRHGTVFPPNCKQGSSVNRDVSKVFKVLNNYFKMFGLHFWRALILSIFMYSQCLYLSGAHALLIIL